jgi:hypothetical protein
LQRHARCWDEFTTIKPMMAPSSYGEPLSIARSLRGFKRGEEPRHGARARHQRPHHNPVDPLGRWRGNLDDGQNSIS